MRTPCSARVRVTSDDVTSDVSFYRRRAGWSRDANGHVTYVSRETAGITNCIRSDICGPLLVRYERRSSMPTMTVAGRCGYFVYRTRFSTVLPSFLILICISALSRIDAQFSVRLHQVAVA